MSDKDSRGAIAHSFVALDANRPILIRSAHEFCHARASLEWAAEHVRLARLAGALHLLAELIASDDMIAGAQIQGAAQAGDPTSSGLINLLLRALDGF
jgi:hypothetical protein